MKKWQGKKKKTFYRKDGQGDCHGTSVRSLNLFFESTQTMMLLPSAISSSEYKP
jgi:hypothetical protein